MTTTKTPNATLTTDFRDIFGKPDVFEVKLSQRILEILADGTVYITAKTEHQARMELVNCLVVGARKLSVQKIGEMAIQELERQRNGDTEETTEPETGE